MRALEGGAERGPIVSAGVLVSSLAVLALSVLAGLPILEVTAVVLVVVVGAAWYRTVLRWQSLLAVLILDILFIPIRRYTMPGSLPFELEPYRVIVGLLALAWVSSLLIDPRVRVRASRLEPALVLILAAAFTSVLVNGDRIHELAVHSVVNKKLTFLISFFVVFYVIVSLVRTLGAVTFLVKCLVAGGAIIACFAIWESRTEYNLFNHLDAWVPFLEPQYVREELPGRGARLRAYASAQHPIALGAALVMLIPLAVYLARSAGRRKLWMGAAGVLVLGALATVSRTSVIMLFVVGLVFLWLRPKETRRLWPVVLPALVVIHFALPGHLGTLKSAFFPKGGLIEEQRGAEGTRGSGRVADLGPALDTYSESPLVGLGYGTRIVTGPDTNAPILDNQWLATLIETGALGVFAWAWLFLRVVRRLVREAKEDPSPRGWLLAGIAASLTAYAVSMFTYDAFSFIQSTFLLFILMGFGTSLLRPDPARARQPVTRVERLGTA